MHTCIYSGVWSLARHCLSLYVLQHAISAAAARMSGKCWTAGADSAAGACSARIGLQQCLASLLTLCMSAWIHGHCLQLLMPVMGLQVL